MRVIKYFSKTKFGQRFIGFVFYSLTSFVHRSIRWKYLIESEKSNIFNNNQKMIFCCWHNRLFLGPHILPRNRIINALQSSHSDGMITSTAFKFLGMNVILGSSNRGGMQAFRQMVKCMQLGESVAITPDGPKGPKEKVKDGIIKLAQITNSPIIPLVWSTKKFKIINLFCSQDYVYCLITIRHFRNKPDPTFFLKPGFVNILFFSETSFL